MHQQAQLGAFGTFLAFVQPLQYFPFLAFTDSLQHDCILWRHNAQQNVHKA